MSLLRVEVEDFVGAARPRHRASPASAGSRIRSATAPVMCQWKRPIDYGGRDRDFGDHEVTTRTDLVTSIVSAADRFISGSTSIAELQATLQAGLNLLERTHDVHGRLMSAPEADLEEIIFATPVNDQSQQAVQVARRLRDALIAVG